VRVHLLTAIVFFASALMLSDARADNGAQEQPMDPVLVHQGFIAGCEYGFHHDPKSASLPPELGNNLCTCVDNWFQANGLNDMKSIEANKPMMPQVMVYCMQQLAKSP
jgi:hypothetical protein